MWLNPVDVSSWIKEDWALQLNAGASITVTIQTFLIIARISLTPPSGASPTDTANLLAGDLQTSLGAGPVNADVAPLRRHLLAGTALTVDVSTSTGSVAAHAVSAMEQLTSPSFLETLGAALGLGALTLIDYSFSVIVTVTLADITSPGVLALMLNSLPTALDPIVHSHMSPPPPSPSPPSPPFPPAVIVSKTVPKYALPVGLAVGLSVLVGAVSYAAYRFRRERPKAVEDLRRNIRSCLGDTEAPLAHKPLLEEEVTVERSSKARETLNITLNLRGRSTASMFGVGEGKGSSPLS